MSVYTVVEIVIVYGSRKPGGEAYDITHHRCITDKDTPDIDFHLKKFGCIRMTNKERFGEI